MRLLPRVMIIAALLALQLQPVAAQDELVQQAVLVTGASSGIGRNITERLAADGYRVYAGARKEKDLAELDAIDNVTAVRLDVTKQHEVDAVAALIHDEGRGLHGLVNNAGVAVFGPLTQAPQSDFQFVMDVNVAGVMRVTQAMLPMILEGQGRITTIGSISGILSSANLGIYSMSKHAIEAFTDSLAAELGPRGVFVSVIEPGNFKSKIRRTTTGRTIEKIKASGEMTAEELAEMEQQTAARELSLKDPDAVSAAVVDALFGDDPKRRYMVVPDASEAEMTINKAIEELVQLNERQEFSYDRDQLVEMLDNALTTD